MRKILAFIGAAVVLVPLLAVVVGVWLLLPAGVGFLVLGLMLGAFLWWWLRRRGLGSPASESSLTGRQSQKEGLL